MNLVVNLSHPLIKEATNWNRRHHGSDLNDCHIERRQRWPRFFGGGSSSLGIINQDKNVMQKIQKTTLFNL